jgi:hypothetical protein
MVPYPPRHFLRQGCLPAQNLPHSLNAVGEDIHQFALGAHADDVVPLRAHHLEEFTETEIPESEVNHAGRRFSEQDAVGEIRILGDDGEVVLPRMIPNAAVIPLIINISDMDELRAVQKGEPCGTVHIDEIHGRRGHATALTI